MRLGLEDWQARVVDNPNYPRACYLGHSNNYGDLIFNIDPEGFGDIHSDPICLVNGVVQSTPTDTFDVSEWYPWGECGPICSDGTQTRRPKTRTDGGDVSACASESRRCYWCPTDEGVPCKNGKSYWTCSYGRVLVPDAEHKICNGDPDDCNQTCCNMELRHCDFMEMVTLGFADDNENASLDRKLAAQSAKTSRLRKASDSCEAELSAP